MLFGRLGRGGDFFGLQLSDADVAQRGRGTPGRDPQRLAQVHFGPDSNTVSLGRQVDHLFVVDPGFDFRVGHPNPYAIPLRHVMNF